MSKMATPDIGRSIYFMREQLERIERTLKKMQSEQEEIYNYSVVPNESTSVSSMDDIDYESSENKRFRGKTE
jgi:hypothetical protein